MRKFNKTAANNATNAKMLKKVMFIVHFFVTMPSQQLSPLQQELPASWCTRVSGTLGHWKTTWQWIKGLESNGSTGQIILDWVQTKGAPFKLPTDYSVLEEKNIYGLQDIKLQHGCWRKGMLQNSIFTSTKSIESSMHWMKWPYLHFMRFAGVVTPCYTPGPKLDFPGAV